MQPNKHFFAEIKDRLLLQIKPFNHLYFSYVFFFLIIVGGLGIWISIIQESKVSVPNIMSISLNISTYFIALFSTSFIDLHTNHGTENKLSFMVYSVITGLVLCALFVLSLLNSGFTGLILSSIGFVISVLVWHIANSNSDKFSDETYNRKMREEAKAKHGNTWGNG